MIFYNLVTDIYVKNNIKVITTLQPYTMKRLLISIIAISSFIFISKAQTDTIRYFESYFETSADRGQWTNVPSDNNKNWIFNSQGGYVNSADGLNYNPDAAYEGNYNAFHVWSDFNPDIRKIVSKPFDLSDSKKPELTFAHAMFESVFGSNTLAVLFKAGSSAPWDTIIHYYNPINEWTTHSLNIKDFGSKYLCKDFQIAFQSQARGEFGVCIDSVIIVEKDIIVRYVKSVQIHQIKQDPVPSGVSDLPLMRVDVNIVGNTDSVKMNSIEITSLSSHDTLFAQNGFELVITRDSTYRATLKGSSLKIGDEVSISGGKIIFNNLDLNLNTGYNAIWFVADIKSTAPYGSVADFKILADAISIGTDTWPAAEVSPAGYNTIEESVFFDSFEELTTWTISPDFETDVPEGFTAFITRDPDFAYSGAKILGTDLTVDGMYRFNINSGNAYYATTPSINLKYYNDVKLSFKQWIAFEGNDQGVIEVSNDDGETWQKIWDSKTDALTPDNYWVSYLLRDEFNAIAAHHEQVKIRFGVIYSDGNFAYSGFNIDNFAVTGNYLTNDVGIVDVSAPLNDCHNPGMDSVTVTIRNYADRPTASSIPVFFSIDGSEGKRVFENIPGPIPIDGIVTYTFAHTADFPSPGNYASFTVKLQASGDEDPDNNTRVKSIFLQKSISAPHYETFEEAGGYWKIYGSDPRWLCRIPEGSIPAETGNSWISSPFGNYITEDTSYLESSCYNLISEDYLILQLNYWMDSEPGKDGAAIEYSLDNGITWNYFSSHSYDWNWDWYNGPVTSLGTSGWSGINTENWVSARQVIPEMLLHEDKVKFRLVWASDSENTYRGMAMDEVRIYPAPADIGISVIDSFANRCEGLNPNEVTVAIKNFGINALKQNDTLIAGFSFNNVEIEIDTFLLNADLLPGNTIKHTFGSVVDVSEPGNYNITAYTLLEDDPWFYEGNNDTISVGFEVYQAPLATLTDTIQTYLPDTVVLVTLFDATYDYWWNGISGGNTYNVSDDGWQHLKVTAIRGNGCSAYDSTNVELLFSDLGAISILHPVDGCGFSTNENPVVRIQNFGTDSINAGQKIAVLYSINNEMPKSDTLVLERTLLADKTVDFTFTVGQADLSQKGIYNFSIYTVYGGDTIAINDTVKKSVEILGRPDVSLGPDITVEALSYTLDAGSGYESYLWDNNETEQIREVTQSGTYWVKVYDENLCDNYDTAYVRLKIRDVSTQGFASPVSDCSFDFSVPVIIRVVNSGTDTVPVASSIIISYKFMDDQRITDTIILTEQLVPGGQVTGAFNGTVDLGTAGDFPIEATVSHAGDLISGNDTTIYHIYRYPAPVVDFGLDETEYVEDVSFDIDAGFNPAYSYQWHDTAWHENIYTTTESGLCHVRVTDMRTLCYDRDSVVVYLIYSDVGVTWSDMPESGCSGPYDDVQIEVTNLGPSVIGNNSPIYLACDANGSRVVVDTLTRTGNFNPGATMILTLTERVMVSHGGVSNISFYTIYPEDLKPQNDTLVRIFNALPAPEIDFGDVNGELTVDLPYILDAGAGHLSYLWQDNSTDQTYNVTDKGEYRVAVTGMNNCETTKTVRVNMQSSVDDFAASKLLVFPNPNQGSFRIKMDPFAGDIVVKILNNMGQLVYMRTLTSVELNNETIEVQHLARGVYYLLLQSGNELFKGKVVIE